MLQTFAFSLQVGLLFESTSQLEEKRQIKMCIIFFYEIIHHLVAIYTYPTNLLTSSDPRTRQDPHSYSYRLIQTTKYLCKYSFSQEQYHKMERPPICSFCRMHYTIRLEIFQYLFLNNISTSNNSHLYKVLA